MVGNLEEVERGQAAPEELRIDALLDVTCQQEALAADLAEQDDRHVVDRRPAVGRPLGNATRIRPQDAEVNGIEAQLVAARQPSVRRPAFREDRRPGVVARSRPDHARLVDPPHAVPLEQRREPRHVVLVRMREHEHVDPPVPRRQPLVEREQQAARIRPAIDDHAPAAIADHEDPVALPDIEHDDVDGPVGLVRERQHQRHGGRDERQCSDSRRLRPARCPAAPPARDGRARGHRANLACDACPQSRQDRRSLARGQRDQHRREDRCHDVPRALQREARQRQAGTDSNGGNHRRVQRPGGEPGQRRHDRRQPEPCRDAHDKRQRASRHRRWHEGDHDQVHERRDEGQPPEVEQHDRRGGRLRGERDTQDIGHEAPDATRRRPGEPLRQARAPGEDAGGREGREPEPGVVDPGGIDEQQRGACPAQRRDGAPRAPDLPREERHARHRSRPNHRWRWPDEGHVDDDARRRQQRPPPSPDAAGERTERRRDDRDVPARDGDDVARAGGRERGGEVAIDQVAQADEHAGGEARFRLRHGPLQAVGRGTPPALERPPEGVRRRQELDRIRTEGARGADLVQVVAVLALGRRPDASAELHAIAGHDRRIPRQRGRNEHVWGILESNGGGPGSLARRPDGLDDADPPPLAIGYGWGRPGRRSGGARAQADRKDPDRDGQQRSRGRAPVRRRSGEGQARQRAARERNHWSRARPEAERTEACPDREPRRARHVSRP